MYQLMARNRVHNIFQNISSIMNCVGCEKCKVWSKLQVLGLSTAVKIIMSDEDVANLDLQRNEIIVRPPLYLLCFSLCEYDTMSSWFGLLAGPLQHSETNVGLH